MTQSDKDLLLQDLSARLPYKMKFQSSIGILEMNELNLMNTYPVWANTSNRKENPDLRFIRNWKLEDIMKQWSKP